MTTRPSIIEQRIEWTTGFRCATDKRVLQTMARWFAWRPDGRDVRFVVTSLARKAGVPKRSTERALERLEADWWIEVTVPRRRGSRRPTTYRIVLERLARTDPDALTIVGSTSATSSATVADEPLDQPPEWRMNEAHNRHSGGCDPKWRMKNWPEIEKVADEVADVEVRTKISTEEAVRTAAPPASVLVRQRGGRPEHPDVPTFLAWAIATYPQHAHGARLVLDRDRDGYLVHGLLEHYALDRLQAMAVHCWTLQADRDPASHASWIARSDRSLRVLRHKAAFLERVVVGAMQLTLGPLLERPLSQREVDEATHARRFVYGRCPHEPRHANFTDCVREIALARRVV